MAIQIEEKLLSAKAKEALSNAKSKSKLLRDALEAYVRNELGQNTQDVQNTEIQQDIKDIKNILQKLTESGLPDTITRTTQEISVTLDNSNTKEPFEKDIQENNATLKKFPKQQNVKSEEVDITTKPVKPAGNNQDISEEQKRQIEAMYDASLESFGE